MLTIDGLLAAGAPPIVAILRGLESKAALGVTRALIEAGVRLIEVPLNSPDPFDSIAQMQAEFGTDALIGAGTVLDVMAAERLADTGARLMVTPNTNAQVIAAGLARGLEVMPGFLTPTEAFVAIAAGARRLKLFPASVHGPAYIKAVREVLPSATGIWAVGGVNAAKLGDWLAAGAEGVALGTALYRCGDEPATVAARAAEAVSELAR